MAAFIENETAAEQANIVMVFSDAPTNGEAIREIGQWARQHGFVRPNEYHLQTRLTKEGKLLFQSVCYRLDEANERAATDYLDRVARRRETMPSLDLEVSPK